MVKEKVEKACEHAVGAVDGLGREIEQMLGAGRRAGAGSAREARELGYRCTERIEELTGRIRTSLKYLGDGQEED